MSEREEYSGDLSAYLDGELSESRQQRLDKVLQYDQELAREMDRLRATRELIRTLPTAQPPRDFAARVVARGERVRLLGTLRRPRSYQWINLAAAAVVLVAAGLSLVIMLRLPSKQLVDTFDNLGTVALDTKDTPKGDAAETNGKTVDDTTFEKVAKTGLREELAKETLLAKFGKGGPGGGKLGEDSIENGGTSYVSKTGAGQPAPMRSKGSLATTLAIARQAAGRLSKDGLDEGDIVIYTDSLAFAQADVENVLEYNGIHPVSVTTTASAVPGKRFQARMGFFNTKQTTVSQVKYEVFASPQQAVKVKNELNVIREQQKVSQDAIPPGIDLAAARTPKLAMVARRKADDDYKDDQIAGKKAGDEVKLPPGQAKPKPAKPTDTTRGRKVAVAYAGEKQPPKAEDKPVTKAKAAPAPKTPGVGDKEATPKPGPTPSEAGVELAGIHREAAPAPVVTAPARGTVAGQKATRGIAEAETHLTNRPDFRQRPNGGEPFAGQKKYRTGTATAPARPPMTTRPSTQNALAMTQRDLQIKSQAGANVMRLLITLNYRDASTSRADAKALKAAEAMKKAASQKARPAAKDAANQAH